MNTKLEDLKGILAGHGYKLTSQRKLILQVLLDNKGEHLSAEEVYNNVKEENPDVGLATVYRTLELFCQLGIAKQITFNDNCRRYELENDESHHHHLICNNCGKVIEFNDEILEEFERNLQKSYDFKVTEHRIKFYGLCKDCSVSDEHKTSDK